MADKRASRNGQLAEVWNDTVGIRELAMATLLGVVLGVACYVLAALLLPRLGWGNADQQKGYALLFGIVGCLASGFMSASFFKPKREFVAGARVSFREAVTSLGIDPEEEIAAIRASSPENRRELEDLGIIEELSRWS